MNPHAYFFKILNISWLRCHWWEKLTQIKPKFRIYNYLGFVRISWRSSKVKDDEIQLLYSNSHCIIFSFVRQMLLLWHFHSKGVSLHVPLHGYSVLIQLLPHIRCFTLFLWSQVLLQFIFNFISHQVVLFYITKKKF